MILWCRSGGVCANPRPVNRAPVDFTGDEDAISDLFAQVKQNQGLPRAFESRYLSLIPLSMRILRRSTKPAAKSSRFLPENLLAFPSFRIEPMSLKNLPIANYAGTGTAASG